MGFFGFLLKALRIRKDITTREKLQNIDDELEKLDTRLRRNQQLQKSVTVYLVTLSVLIYIISIVIVYLWYFPVLWSHRIIYISIYILFPLLVYLSKKLLQHIFINKIHGTAAATKELKKDKKKILENVMDTETYKVAKELLQKYDPNGSLVAENVSPVKPVTPKPEGQELRRRNVPPSVSKPPPQSPHSTSNGYPMAPLPPRMPSLTSASPIMRTPAPMMRAPVPTIRGAAPIAPILPRERSVFDKVADYFIGDGPNNRFALICKQCFGHNGMVLTEEFDFTSYRCCYCGFFNQARKQRMYAPKLERSKLARSSSVTSTASTDVESSTKDDTEDKAEESTAEENNTVFEESTRTDDGSVKTEEHGEPIATSEDTRDVQEEKDDESSEECDITSDVTGEGSITNNVTTSDVTTSDVTTSDVTTSDVTSEKVEANTDTDNVKEES